MESHTLEILQQGVWASLTGGWFYDLRQNVFCNTFHLYLWLFLLCFPFVLHLYFVPSVVVYSLYCGLIGSIFTVLKFLNHRLHKIFDSAECVQEMLPGEDLPESQKKRSRILKMKNIVEDEGIELQVLSKKKVSTLISNSSICENVSDERRVSSEYSAKPSPNTIDFKVDFHRKNSSESLEESQENVNSKSNIKIAKEEFNDQMVEFPQPLNLELSTSRHKHKSKNNNLIFKNDERISDFEGDDFELSQSDCYIAKHRKKSFDELSKEYKMSQSDCQISNFKENTINMCNIKKISANSQSSYICYDNSGKNCFIDCCDNPKHDIDYFKKNRNFESDDLPLKCSFEISLLNSCINESKIVNAGSLETPLQNINDTSTGKGLLYWKQQNLNKNVADKKNCYDETHDNCKKFTTEGLLLDYPNQNYQNSYFQKIIDTKPIKTTCKSQEILTNYNVSTPTEDSQKCHFKLPIDSDEDSSDNCGSQSPLLLNLESCNKCFTRSSNCLAIKETNSDKLCNCFIEEQLSNCSFNLKLCSKKNSGLLSEESKCRSLFNSAENQSLLLSNKNDEVDQNEFKNQLENKHLKNISECDFCLVYVDTKKVCFRHKNKKTYLINSRSAEDILIKKKEVTNIDENVDLNWLFENYEDKENKDQGPNENKKLEYKKPFHKQGAIPKAKQGTEMEWKNCRKKNSTKNLLQNERLNLNNDTAETKKGKSSYSCKIPTIKSEQETIKEEDNVNLQIENENFSVECERHLRDKSDLLKETYDSSSSSTTELSSLLPLSSLLSSFHPPTSPLLTAFLATRKDISNGYAMPTAQGGTTKKRADVREQKMLQYVNRNRQKRSRRFNRGQRICRSSRVSTPLTAFASIMNAHSETSTSNLSTDISISSLPCLWDGKEKCISQFENKNSNLCQFSNFLSKISENMNDFKINDPNCNDSDQNLSHFKNGSHLIFDEALNRTNYLCFNNFKGTFKNSNCSHTIDDIAESSSPAQETTDTEHCSSRNFQKSEVLLDVWNSNCHLNMKCSPTKSKSYFNKTNCALEKNGHNSFSSNNKQRFSAEQHNITNIASCSDATKYPINLNLNSNVGEICQSDNINNDKNNNIGNANSFNKLVNNCENVLIFTSNFFSAANNTTIDFSADTAISTTTAAAAAATTVNLADKTTSKNYNLNEEIVKINFHQKENVNSVRSVSSPLGLAANDFVPDNHRQSTSFDRTGILENSQPLGPIQRISEEESDSNHLWLFDFDDMNVNVELKRKPKRYYKFHYTPWNYVKIRFDRLELMALLDRNLTFFEIFVSLLLSILVSLCGIILLNYGFYRDFFAFLFCFALAGCQYSLLKSVQPDATSPTHGYNRIVVFSRAIYFCLISLLILSLTAYLNKKTNLSFQFYSIQFDNGNIIRIFRDCLVNLLLFFPVLFTLGFFPQINTFCLYLLEQLDVHLFGGNAMSSLVGAIYCVIRSIIASAFIYGFAYGALSETKTSQHILFSIFCSLLISFSYHLSRSTGNPTLFWEIVKEYFFQDELQHKIQSNEMESELSKNKLEKSVNDSLKSEDRNSQNNLLLSSNPSSNEILKIKDDNVRSNSSATLENVDSSCNSFVISNDKKECDKDKFVDPLPQKLKRTVNARLKNDAIICTFVALLVFGIHCSTLFTILQPDLNPILWGIAGCSGFVLHYVVPEMRKHLPWLCLAKPVLKGYEHAQFEVRKAARVMWFEETYVVLCFLEKNLLYPVLVLATLTYDGPRICHKFGVPLGALVTSICGLKIMRSAFSNTSQQYLIVVFSALIFEFDYYSYSETFLVDYFFTGIVFSKIYEFLLKIQFVVIYIAPWQITWGSAFHAFAQPFSVPHSAMLFIQAALSAFLSAPLNPFLGSAIFLTSYVRPIKFWERDYNTKRVDHSNTRMSCHIDRNLGSDDNNLNSIFYEHLTRSLQHSLCGDLELGRWGLVSQGDCFVLASDYLNCLVHIIEIGNGLVTFQMRGLEFRGTYCQQREVEAISERVEDDDGCCCCDPCHIPHLLSVNAAFSKRWLAWEVTASKYVLEGYSISDNSAASTLQVFDFRKVLVTYYVKSIIYFCIRSHKLQSWLTNPTILKALETFADRSFVDLDPVFNINIDQDFDIHAEGITKNSFCNVYLEWIHYCCSKREKLLDKALETPLILLCLALSLIGRRTLGTASHNTVSSVEFFLYGLHALFKGDFRITSARDDWIFVDMEFLLKVIAPGVRMSLKLHQDHFMSPEEYEDPSALFQAISSHEENLVISHEGDPAWRSAVLSGTPSLLALRHVLDDGSDEYKIIMLNKRFLSFRVIKLNRECVRGLWAGQQQELVFLRNRNPERGSIQNAKQVLRNMINSSCDQPIGYPIYVSPLTTSYSDTNKQYTSILGGPISFKKLRNFALKLWRRIGKRCRQGCSSGGINSREDGGCIFGQEGVYAMNTTANANSGHGYNTSGSISIDSSQIQLNSCNRGGSLGRGSVGGRGSFASVGKPSSTTLASLAGPQITLRLLSSTEIPKNDCFLREKDTSFTFLKEKQNREDKDLNRKIEDKKDEKDKRRGKDKMTVCSSPNFSDDNKTKEKIYQRVRIIQPTLVYDAINLGRRIDVLWPDEEMRMKGGRSYWKDWLPDAGMEGQVVHRWIPNHGDPAKRSNVDKTILLVQIEDKFVPIAEAGVQDLGVEV